MFKRTEGRFAELRQKLGSMLDCTEDILGMAVLDRAFRELEQERHHLDSPDNYFTFGGDELRLPPKDIAVSLVPLASGVAHVGDRMVGRYLRESCQSVDEGVNDNLVRFSYDADLTAVLGRYIGQGGDAYSVGSRFGIGAKVGEDVISDSPFNITVSREESPLLSIGFWCRGFGEYSVAVVDQISCDADRDESRMLGGKALSLLCAYAEISGFGEVWAYPASRNPLFIMHPQERPSQERVMEGYFDGPAGRLGFDGHRQTFFAKKIR